MPSIINATLSNGLVTSADNSGSLQLATNNGTTAVTIDTSQNVGINTSSPSSKLHVAGTGFVSDTFQVSGTATAVNSNGIGLEFRGGSTPSVIAYSRVGSAYLPITNSASLHTWDTSGTERMRIVAGGSVKMTTTGNYRTSTGSLYEMNINNSNEIILELTNEASTGPFGQRTRFSAASPNNTTQYFYNAVDSTTSCFTIWSNGTTSGRSDERLKKNISDASPKLEDICKLQVRNYEWKESAGGSKEIGLIAQEVEQVFPNLVVTHDVEKQGDDYKEVKYSVFVPMLIKAIQELNAKVETQAVRIAELEGAK